MPSFWIASRSLSSAGRFGPDPLARNDDKAGST